MERAFIKRMSDEVTKRSSMNHYGDSNNNNMKESLTESILKSEFGKVDTYVTALLCVILFNSNESDERANEIADIVSRRQQNTGAFDLGIDTITMSLGSSLVIETSALSGLCLLRNPSLYSSHLSKVKQFLLEQNNHGTFGSTQGTVLSLQFLVESSIQMGKTEDVSMNLSVMMNGSTITSLPISPRAETLTISSTQFSQFIQKDQRNYTVTAQLIIAPRKVETVETSHSSMADMYPLSLSVKYTSLTQPTTTTRHSLSLTHSPSVKEGELAFIDVKVQVSDQPLGMTVAVIGTFAGTSIHLETLEKLVKEEQISFFEIRGLDIVLYWKGLGANESRSIRLHVKGDIPGEYSGSASWLYEYYYDESKYWVEGMKLSVV